MHSNPTDELAAQDPLTDPDTLQRLALDNSEYVRQCVASNPSTPFDAMIRLAGDVSRLVRKALAGNPMVPDQALRKLATDADLLPRLTYDALAAIGTPPMSRQEFADRFQDACTVLDFDAYDARLAAWYAPYATGLELWTMASIPEPRVLREVARNLRCPPGILRKLATHPDAAVRQAVASNPRTPPSVRLLATEAL